MGILVVTTTERNIYLNLRFMFIIGFVYNKWNPWDINNMCLNIYIYIYLLSISLVKFQINQQNILSTQGYKKVRLTLSFTSFCNLRNIFDHSHDQTSIVIQKFLYGWIVSEFSHTLPLYMSRMN